MFWDLHMLVTVICFDKPNHVDLRMKLRPTHLAWLEKSGVNIPKVYVGPMLADDGTTPIGTLIIAEFADVAAARAFAKRRSLQSRRIIRACAHSSDPQGVSCNLT